MGEAQPHIKEHEEELLERAKILASNGQWEEAASIIENGQMPSKLSPRLNETIAFYYSKAEDFDKAISIFSELCQRQPTEAKWPYYLGFQFQQKKLWDNAIASYEECVKLAPCWLKALFSLGKAYGAAGQIEKSLTIFRRSILLFKGLSSDLRLSLTAIYGKLCTTTAQTLLSRPQKTPDETTEALQLLRESAEVTPNDHNGWYRVGNLLFTLKRYEEALIHLKRAEELAPRNEYICHKIAQIHLKDGKPDEALQKYEKIPPHRQAPYLLRGIAQCYLGKGEPMEAAKRLHQAIKKEPHKFYHYWDFALALIELKGKDQALEALDMANQLFSKEHGKTYDKAMAKIEEIKSTLPSGERIIFEAPSNEVSSICFGLVTKYNQDRGFGFITDRNDGATVFFHISRVRDSSVPQEGNRAKFIREVGEKGPLASRVWLSGFN